jgi:hypothetical protein
MGMVFCVSRPVGDLIDLGVETSHRNGKDAIPREETAIRPFSCFVTVSFISTSRR